MAGRAVARHGHLLIGVALALLTAVVLAAEIRRSYSFDEGVTIGEIISTGSPVTALTSVVVLNNHLTFSVVQAAWWSLGGDSEAFQRVLPIMYGAAAVGLLTTWVARRWGMLAGATAGLVLAVNPMFVSVARDIRGYSLSVLAAVVAVITLVEYLGRPRRWLLVAHGAALVVGVTTHAFVVVSLVPLAAAALVITRARDRALWSTWIASVAAAVLIYLPTLGGLLDVRDDRGSEYRPGWFRTTSWELLGRDRLAASLFATMAIVGFAIYASRRADRRVAVGVAVAAIPIQMWLWWQILQPFDLYPRFFVSVVPLVALGVAMFVRYLPFAAIAVAVGVLAMAPHTASVRRRQTPVREVATVINEARDSGALVCVVGGEALTVYASPPLEIRVPPRPITVDDAAELFGECEMFVRIGTWGRPLVAPAEAWFTTRDRIGSIDIFTDPAAEEAPDV